MSNLTVSCANALLNFVVWFKFDNF